MKPSLALGVEPHTLKFLEGLAASGGPPIHTLSVADARKVLIDAQSAPVARPEAIVDDESIPGGPAGDLSVRVVRPANAKGVLPVVIYLHGGGWVLGDSFTHDRLVRELADGSGAAIVFVNYTPSPEARYPEAIEQAYAVANWIAQNGVAWNLDGSRLAIAGDSVGGNMTAAVTMLAKERGGPAIRFQLLFYPVTDSRLDTGSYRDFAEGFFLTRDAMKWFWDQYAPDPAVREYTTAAPLRATEEQLRGLPPALVITAEFDVLRDEGEAYARKLSAAGVTVVATRYLGAIHDFVMLNPIAHAPTARGAIAQAAAALKRALAE